MSLNKQEAEKIVWDIIRVILKYDTGCPPKFSFYEKDESILDETWKEAIREIQLRAKFGNPARCDKDS